MKKFLVSMVAVFAATSAFAADVRRSAQLSRSGFGLLFQCLWTKAGGPCNADAAGPGSGLDDICAACFSVG